MVAQQVVNGLVAGAAYALFALGLTLVFGVHKILNLAHGGIFMAGAFIGVHAVMAGLPLPVALIVALLGRGTLSVVVDVVAFRRLRRIGSRVRGHCFEHRREPRDRKRGAAAIGVRYSALPVRHLPGGVLPRPGTTDFPPAARDRGWRGDPAAGLTWYIHRTSFGRQVRAVASNERTAALLGVNPGFVYFQAFFLSGALAGAAGVLIKLSFNTVHFMMGDTYLLRAFVVVVLGGIGSIAGSVIAGLLLGVIQTLTAAYLPSGPGDAIIFW